MSTQASPPPNQGSNAAKDPAGLSPVAKRAPPPPPLRPIRRPSQESIIPGRPKNPGTHTQPMVSLPLLPNLEISRQDASTVPTSSAASHPPSSPGAAAPGPAPKVPPRPQRSPGQLPPRPAAGKTKMPIGLKKMAPLRQNHQRSVSVAPGMTGGATKNAGIPQVIPYRAFPRPPPALQISSDPPPSPPGSPNTNHITVFVSGHTVTNHIPKANSLGPKQSTLRHRSATEAPRPPPRPRPISVHLGAIDDAQALQQQMHVGDDSIQDNQQASAPAGTGNFFVMGAKTRPRSPSLDKSDDVAAAAAGQEALADGSKSDFINVNLNSLDLEALYPKPAGVLSVSDKTPSRRASARKIMGKFGTLVKGLVLDDKDKDKDKDKDDAMELEGGPTDEEVANWPSVVRTRRQWPASLDETGVPKEVKVLVNHSVLDQGFHIEVGDSTASKTPSLDIDHQSEYLLYYKDNLYPIPHSNYIGVDEENDVYYIVSLEERRKGREKLRALVRSRKDYIRLLVDSTQDKDKLKSLKAAMPELAKISFVKVKSQELADELMKMEEKEVALGGSYKFGVMYAKAGQTEDEMFANENPPPDMEEFHDFLGDRITLLGWEKYRGGLDVKSNTTGLQSVFYEAPTQWGTKINVMYHCCTLLPAQEHDVQRVERKRHIGNDVICIVFKEGDEPFLPTLLTSQFIHIVVVVQKLKGDGPTKYAISISTKTGVEPHLPAMPAPAIYEKTPALRDWLIAKCINAERTAMLSPEFRSKMLRSRKEFLKLLHQSFVLDASKKKKS